MTDKPLDPSQVRDQFPAFSRLCGDQPVAYFDGPAGSQVPQCVIDAVGEYLAHANANCGGPTATSRATDAMFNAARKAMGDLLGTEETDGIVFGANMTTLTFSLSRTLAQTWKPGDEIILSRLDHDANVTPWVIAAERAGVTVRHIDIQTEDCTLNLDQFDDLLTDRTRLVAVGAASNATGTINPIGDIVARSRSVGALTYVDAVHYAPHRLIDVSDWGCDFVVCSAYKFFGPHVGILWGQPDRLDSLRPDHLRPVPEQNPDKWMTGTQCHEGIAGVIAAVDYLASLSSIGPDQPRRQRLVDAFGAIERHERELSRHLLAGLQQLPAYRVWGVTDPRALELRVPTVSVTHRSRSPQELVEQLAEQGIYAWAGNHYAVPFTTAAGLEPNGTLRVGALHYNTLAEIDRLLGQLAALT